MTDAKEFRNNAQVCGSIAKTCKSPDEREQWLRMQRSWLALAGNEEKRTGRPRQDEAARDRSSRQPQL